MKNVTGLKHLTELESHESNWLQIWEGYINEGPFE
jgi:hypothetical protein